MQHLDEGTIHAWLDGALVAEEAARVDAHVASCARCADAVAEARGLIAASSRILTALDQVPSIRGSRGSAGSRGSTGSRWTGRPLATAFVRQRIAAVIALIVVGGAVALTVAREESPQVALEAAPMAEVVVVDSPAPVSPIPAPMQATMPRRERDARASRGEPGRGEATPAPRVRAFDVARQADSASSVAAMSAAPLAAADVAAPPPARVTDTARAANVMAQAERKVEAQEGAAKAAGRLRALGGGRAETEVEERRYARVAPSAAIGAAAGTTPDSNDARLVQEVRMTEGGQEVWRRIYRVDSILVTLDERRPSMLEERIRMPVAPEQRAAAPPLPIDTVMRPVNTIRWRDARGAELTLTGPAPKARLERIRKLLGL